MASSIQEAANTLDVEFVGFEMMSFGTTKGSLNQTKMSPVPLIDLILKVKGRLGSPCWMLATTWVGFGFSAAYQSMLGSKVGVCS